MSSALDNRKPSTPTAGTGRGYSLTGHHELLIPLLAAALIEAAR